MEIHSWCFLCVTAHFIILQLFQLFTSLVSELCIAWTTWSCRPFYLLFLYLWIHVVDPSHYWVPFWNISNFCSALKYKCHTLSLLHQQNTYLFWKKKVPFKEEEEEETLVLWGFILWLKTTEIYSLISWRPKAWKQHVTKVALPQGHQGRILSLFLLASGGCQQCLAFLGIQLLHLSSHAYLLCVYMCACMHACVCMCMCVSVL